MSSAAKPRVIVVGCGVVGPVLALLLKHQGYDPVIYERGSRERNAGLSLLLQLNGLRVLSLIPGLVEQLPGMAVEQTVLYSAVPSDERVLGTSDYPAALRREYGLHGAFGVQRGRFLALLADMASKSGIDVHYDRGVVGVEHGDGFVRVRLSDGGEDTAGLVVGCDGLHSNVRVALFGKEDAAFTGLTQTGGISPSGAFADKKPTIYNFFGDGIHLIAYPISQQTYSWAITRRETETKETWRAMDEHAQDEVRSGPFSRLPFGAGDLVRNAEKITKYGLYDRPELTSWHKGRVVLVGDAAHPTSPHLGQGANQAFEDAYHLVRLLCEYHYPADEEGLSAVFTEFEAKRIARTSALVRGARKAGEARVVEGEDQARARNDVLLKEWEDEEAVLRRIKDVLRAEEEWIDLPGR